MKISYLILSSLIICFLFMAGCKDSPSEVVMKMGLAAREGKKDDFIKGFSEKSKGIINSMIALANAYGLSKNDPLKMLSQAEIIDEQIENDKAYVTIKDGRRSKKILLIKEDRHWKIDIIELEKFWQQRRE